VDRYGGSNQAAPRCAATGRRGRNPTGHLQATMRRAQDRPVRGCPLEREAGVKAEAPLPLSAAGAGEAGGGPGRVPRRDAVLHAANRTRSAHLCKRAPDMLELLR
jgi:hypothetical protein